MKFIKGPENRNEIFIFSRWIEQLSLLIREKLALEGDYHVIRLQLSQALKAFCSGLQNKTIILFQNKTIILFYRIKKQNLINWTLSLISDPRFQ